jgi:diaminopropionate ammonia-lyase
MSSTFLPPADRFPSPLFGDADYAAQRAFFGSHPELTPTPLQSLPHRASALGLAMLQIKDESQRFGLNSFKSVGTTFAMAQLRARGAVRAGATIVCASEGNHGRAVARAAREAGCSCRVYMSTRVAEARVQAIEAEGAAVARIEGSYDDAVRAMAADAGTHGWMVVSDTSTGADDEIPRHIMLGYTRLMDEAEAEWERRPDVIFVPGGVGGLLGAVASWTAWRFGAADRPRVVGVEPLDAACLQTSARAGAPATVPGPFRTVMGGLRCGEVSRVAFDAVRTIVDGYIGIEDEWAFEAMRMLARPLSSDPTLRVGASGAAALGGLLATLADASASDLRRTLALGPTSRVLAIASEGVTEPALFERVVGPMS